MGYKEARTGVRPYLYCRKALKEEGLDVLGLFHGYTKGPGIFWEKCWGTIGEESYRARIVPVIYSYIELKEGIHLVLMQDGAPGYAAADIKADLRERGITVIFWPPYSPDLNPIERVWHMMNYL